MILEVPSKVVFRDALCPLPLLIVISNLHEVYEILLNIAELLTFVRGEESFTSPSFCFRRFS